MNLRLAAFFFCAAVTASQAQSPSWLDPALLAAAKAEGALTVYGSMNEQEALPLWKRFEEATGIPVALQRASDTQLTSRVLIEARAGRSAWDLMATTNISRVPAQLRRPFAPAQAAFLPEHARDPKKLWYGATANYNTPAWNTQFIKREELPKSWEEFASKKQWKGRAAIDGTEFHWLRAMVLHFGEDKGRKLAKDLFDALQPAPIDGHLALARAVGSGDFWITPANYANLTINQMISGAPTDYYGLAPIGLFYTQISLNVNSPHPKAAELAANFYLSRESQEFITRLGRMPARLDVTFNPPDALKKLGDEKIVPLEFEPEEERYWQREFQQLMRPR